MLTKRHPNGGYAVASDSAPATKDHLDRSRNRSHQRLVVSGGGTRSICARTGAHLTLHLHHAFLFGSASLCIDPLASRTTMGGTAHRVKLDCSLLH